jgi:hypothetical protein
MLRRGATREDAGAARGTSRAEALDLARARHARLAAALARRRARRAALAAALDHARTPEDGERRAEALAVLEAAVDATAALLLATEEAIVALALLVGADCGG